MLGRNAGNTILSLLVAIGVYYFVFKDNEVEVVDEQGVEEPIDGNAAAHTNERQEPARQGSSTEFDLVEEDEIDNGAGGTRVDVQRLRIEEAAQRLGNVDGAPVPPPLYAPEGDPIERFDVIDDEEAALVREEDRANNRVLEVNTTPFVPPPPLYVPDNNQATILGVGCGGGLHET